jgi:dTDP-4-dehydrorhamnose 3,5-epimerase-like enzyme
MKLIINETNCGDVANVDIKLSLDKRPSFKEFFKKNKKTKEADVLPEQKNKRDS